MMHYFVLQCKAKFDHRSSCQMTQCFRFQFDRNCDTWNQLLLFLISVCVCLTPWLIVLTVISIFGKRWVFLFLQWQCIRIFYSVAWRQRTCSSTWRTWSYFQLCETTIWRIWQSQTSKYFHWLYGNIIGFISKNIISGSMMTTIDAAAELLTQMGVEFGESDWNSYKTNIVQILKRDGDAGSASQPSQPKRLRSSLSIRSTLGSELHDGEEQQHTQTLDSEIFDVDDFEDTQQPQQPQHETETILAIRKKKQKKCKPYWKSNLLWSELYKKKRNFCSRKSGGWKIQAEKKLRRITKLRWTK